MTVDIFGYWLGAFGFAQHTRQFSAALAQLDQVSAVPWDTALNSSATAASRTDADAAIGIGPIPHMIHVSGKRRIGFVVWETTTVPSQLVRILQELDEVWTPSHWGRRLLLENGMNRGRVHVVPEGVDPSFFRPVSLADDQMQRPFRFLCVGKWEVRKGIADLALAFAREFRSEEPVELILHCYNPNLPESDIDEALRALNLPRHAPIRPSSGPLPLSALAALYRECDVLVQPTKAEGWGLPILEALACGIPAIATNYSAHTDFLNDANGYLVDVARMVEVDDPFFYKLGGPFGAWAQPDLDHLQVLMRRSFENPAERREKGAQGRRDVLERWTWKDAAAIAHCRLHGISTHIAPE
jgi:glycosyltransferase involved in cell wall biosynthesis